MWSSQSGALSDYRESFPTTSRFRFVVINNVSYIRATRQALRGEHSSLLRDTEVSSALLKDIAKKHMDAEASKGGTELIPYSFAAARLLVHIIGLIIQEALYGLFDVDGDDLVIDVTIALQALVHHSQLYVPGDQTKVSITSSCCCPRWADFLSPSPLIQLGIQGFCDPAPFAPKILRIRYQFRGFGHYAEIPDSVPIVLPQAGGYVHTPHAQFLMVHADHRVD